MKKINLFVISLLLANTTSAQKLEGLWYSSDSSRVYEVKKTDGSKYTAVIRSSARKTDTAGYVVIKNLEYNARRKRYEGVIFAVKDGDKTFVKIKFSQADTNKIVLKLSRMFVLDVTINWLRASAELPMTAL